ncbi:RNA polymerase factor sigma-32 [Amaricoccus macauensis]|uniref:RNA polymerase factor sigma-32 n=1 Tax=Amaricoccus macauensis TaxID=57001 RepID=UPI003C7C5896
MALLDTAVKRLAREAMQAEMLDAETELALARAWRDNGDEKALHRLVNAYMRLAISMASKYNRYGNSMPDLIQEAGIGLLKAAEKFDPDRGVRFSTYAVWWIKASIQDNVMRNWSLVRTGSTSSQKSLFFNYHRVVARLEREGRSEGSAIDAPRLREMVAEELRVSVADVEMMEARLSGSDFSLNARQSDDDGAREWVDTLEDDAPPSAETVERDSDLERAREWIAEALGALNTRERKIIMERKLRDAPRTLERIGEELGVSKERVRQLEAQALSKMRSHLQENTGGAAHLVAMG